MASFLEAVTIHYYNVKSGVVVDWPWCVFQTVISFSRSGKA